MPQNSTTVISCAFEDTRSGAPPHFLIDIANTTYTDVRFDIPFDMGVLLNHGLIQTESPEPNSCLAMALINDTNLNNGTTIKCTYTGNTRLEQITLLVYG